MYKGIIYLKYKSKIRLIFLFFLSEFFNSPDSKKLLYKLHLCKKKLKNYLTLHNYNDKFKQRNHKNRKKCNKY
jgi:hypothetical protein